LRIATAAPVSAAQPPTGCSLVIFDPIVWMMHQPPDSVPRPIARCAAMIPIVFCASLAPCIRLSY
jgi:hypothetical protein